MTIRLLIIALAASLATATQAHAQTMDQTGPLGTVGWSSAATLCKLHPNSAASSFNYVKGTVAFTATSYGTIGLACTVPGISNGLAPSDINALAFTFSNSSGQTGGCTVGVYHVDRTRAASNVAAVAATADSGWTSGQSFSGIWTGNLFLTNTYPLNTAHFYEVDIYLYRPQSAVGVCNPTAYGAYLENLVLIQ
ncbi:MAG TPA: hypothetical protein VMH03_02220 [Terriglobales bacterium]|nr:hypothetical protein [Terriglobales bacterium]